MRFAVEAVILGVEVGGVSCVGAEANVAARKKNRGMESRGEGMLVAGAPWVVWVGLDC